MNTYQQILDVNANRLREGIRVIEDISRFILEDEEVTLELKSWRHKIRSLNEYIRIESRRSEEDIGRKISTESELSRKGLRELFTASFKRIQEALRVLEETLKLYDTSLSKDFKEIRFSSYDLEKDLLIKLSPYFRKPPPDDFIYLILSIDHIGERSALDIAKPALDGGVRGVQLRAKNINDKEVIGIALNLSEICTAFDAMFIINDRPDIAVIVDAGGVHLGQDDMKPEDARKIIGPDKIIGLSCHNLEQVRNVDWSYVDYAGFGPIFPTLTKENPDPVVGTELLREVIGYGKPIVAIGGISQENLNQVVDAGCSRAAISKDIMEAVDVEERVRGYVTIFG